ncbi:ribosome maturation factor RimM [Oceanobacillus sp. CF4.6]|uniref:ribosome maturation factor RimM n=1 Tax=Oceanobacillus sp. CF4.6 TaxID=3373080 RepID=UPI003EE4FC08
MEHKMFNVGKIVNTHGIKGEVKIYRISDFEERFEPGESVYIMKDDKPIKLTIATHRLHKSFDLVQFKGYENINLVESLKGCELKIREEQLTDLNENEYYYHEIIGCKVYTTDDRKLGEIKEILSPGANDVWVIKQEKGKDILIPYIDDVVKEIDIDAEKVVIEPMEGLLD